METTTPDDHIHNTNRDDNASATSSGPASSVDQHHCNNNDHATRNNNSSNNNDLAADAYFGGVSEIIEIMEEDEEASITSSSSSSRHNKNNTSTSMINGTLRRQQLTPISEGGIESNTTSLFSIDIHHNNKMNSGRSSDDVVYVAVGKSESSMDALLWTLKHSVQRGSTLVYLIHIFSDIKFIPSPFGGGMVPKTQVSPELVESYLVEDTRKRRELLTKYVDICTLHLVQVETILIESDSVANAILELISVLNMRQLVLGISKSSLRKLKAGKGSATVAGQIRGSATDQGCELTIVCQGKPLNMSEIIGDHPHLHSTSASFSPTAAASPTAASSGRAQLDEQQPASYGSFACCFKA